MGQAQTGLRALRLVDHSLHAFSGAGLAARAWLAYYPPMSNFNRKHRHVALVVALLLCAVIGLVQAATPPPVKLTGEVGPGFTITLKKGNNRVVALKKGLYEITVHDRASNHNFHLVGSGVNRSTSVSKVVTTTWKVTLKPGTYTYRCDPHASMKATFRVTS